MSIQLINPQGWILANAQAQFRKDKIDDLREGDGIWRPRTILKKEFGKLWPVNAQQVFDWRDSQRMLIDQGGEHAKLVVQEYYRTHCVDFINHWCDTYDPRLAGKEGRTARLPFVMFERQEQFVEFILACLAADANGLCEKSRDMGATWVAVAVTVWLWLFWPGVALGWGSNKQEQVERLGDPRSIFEKIRMMIRWLPRGLFVPEIVLQNENLKQYTCINPIKGSIISGEIGENIGRGGRTRAYMVDEAQPLSAKIMTPKGPALMVDMRPGCVILGADGGQQRVLHVNDCGVHDVFRVTFSDGSSAECSPNHLWTVQKKLSRSRESVTLRTYELMEDYVYTSPGGQIQYRYSVPLCLPIDFGLCDKSLPLDPYLLGLLIGDGSTNSRYLKITTADEEVVDAFRRLLPDGVVLGAYDGRYSHNIIDAVGRRGPGVRSRAWLLMCAAGIAGRKAPEKLVPDAYKFASPVARLSVLQGLMDSDGYAARNGASFHTSSNRLADDVAFLVHSLGGMATRRVAKDKRGYLDRYALQIILPGQRLFRLNRKLERHVRKYSAARTIVSIAYINRAPVRCITVERADGLYLTDNFIVTHNSAHLEHPEAVEASLSDTTRVRIDISSVSGLGTVFHRTREAGVEWEPGKQAVKNAHNIFILDWSDHPEKDRQWHDERKQSFTKRGLRHVFAREIERDYSAAREGMLIQPEWAHAATDSHLRLAKATDNEYTVEDFDSGKWIAGLDVADEGVDTNALLLRRGSVAKFVDEWDERDVGVTTRRAISACKPYIPMELQYDSIGLGAAVKAETNRLKDESLLPRELRVLPWSASAKVADPIGRIIKGDKFSQLNRDFFGNFKAQAWWNVARLFQNTYRAIRQLEGDPDEKDYTWEPADIISLSSELGPLLAKLRRELSQATGSRDTRGKLIVDKQPEGAKSPNLADALIMAFWPARSLTGIGMFTGSKMLT